MDDSYYYVYPEPRNYVTMIIRDLEEGLQELAKRPNHEDLTLWRRWLNEDKQQLVAIKLNGLVLRLDRSLLNALVDHYL